MEHDAGLLEIADSLGIDDSFCPVRAMLGAFVDRGPFPHPRPADVQRRGDLRRLLGHRPAAGRPGLPDPLVGDAAPPPARSRARTAVELPGGFAAPARARSTFVRAELERVRAALEAYGRASRSTTSGSPRASRRANRVRRLLAELRRLVFTRRSRARCRPWRCSSPRCWRSTSAPTRTRRSRVLEELLDEVRRRVAAGDGVLAAGRRPRLLGQPGGRSAGDEPAGGRAAAGSAAPSTCSATPWTRSPRTCRRWRPWPGWRWPIPMVGSAADRAERICARDPPLRRRGGDHLAHPRGQPLRLEGDDHRRDRPRGMRTARAGDRGAADHRRDASRRCARGWRRWWRRL